LTANGALDASDKTETNVETGHLKGRLTANDFVGQWIPQDQSTPLPTFLKAGAQPRCDGAGAWKRFDDDRWPVTFSYPASWRLEISNDGVKVTCPNPSFIVYDSYGIEFRQGKQGELADLGFHLIGTKWMYGQGCDETPSHCSLAPVRRREGMTILGADEHEWRVYCLGSGYVAEGEGHEVVLLIGDRWMDLRGEGPPSELIRRIVATADRDFDDSLHDGDWKQSADCGSVLSLFPETGFRQVRRTEPSLGAVGAKAICCKSRVAPGDTDVSRY
jgi:hypothetical protein